MVIIAIKHQKEVYDHSALFPQRGAIKTAVNPKPASLRGA